MIRSNFRWEISIAIVYGPIQAFSLLRYWRAVAIALSLMIFTLLSAYPACAESVFNLPVTPLAAESSPLNTEFKALMRDYTYRLAKARVLNWIPAPTAPNQISDWSVHATMFKDLCAAEQQDCVSLVKAQITILLAAIPAKPDEAHSVDFAILISAIADMCAITNLDGADRAALCHEPLGLTGRSEIARFNQEPLTYAGYAALLWDQLGSEELFSAYYHQHLLLKSFYSTQLAQLAAPAAWVKDAQQKLADNGDPSLAAKDAEVSDQLAAARNYWFLAFIQTIQQDPNFWKQTAKPTSVANLTFSAIQMARLSYLLEDRDAGDKWRQVTQQLTLEHPAAIANLRCAYTVEAARMQLAGALALQQTVNTEEAIRALVQAQCAYTQYALDAGLAHLRTGQVNEAVATIRIALDACRQGKDCSASRVYHLQQLWTIAQGAPEDLLRQSGYWLKESLKGVFNGRERQIIWALATSLDKTEYGHADAMKLIVALDDQLQFFRRRLENTASDFKNLARYDQLSRLRVRLAVQDGNAISLADSETMRAQSVLQKLRLKRWEKDFKDVHDEVALEKMQATQQAIKQGKAAAHDSLRMAQKQSMMPAQKEALNTLADTMQSMMAEQDAIARELYVNQLARRKMEAMDQQSYQEWFYNGTSFLSKHEDRGEPRENGRQAVTVYMPSGDGRSVIVSASSYLMSGQAYLSWLQVPQGYVATLAAPEKDSLTSLETWLQHSVYIPMTAERMATVSLYRHLLQTGAGASRGATLVHNASSDKQGLLLHGIPVWRCEDNTFVATLIKPQGAIRATSLREISEALYGMLMAPFQTHLRNTQELILSPDGELAYLPFETLSNEGLSLQEQFTISYVQSLAVHSELMRRAEAATTKGKTLLSLADPDYEQPTHARRPSASNSSSASLATSAPEQEMVWSSLPGTKDESNQLMHLYPTGKQLLGKSASRRNLHALQTNGRLSQYGILHFATHGIVDDTRSALVLSMANGVQEGYLNDVDVLDLQLNSSLVILSACDTAIGRNVRGEGIVGLPYAFVLAGNSNTLMSLWQVDDKGTAKFMSVFMGKVSKEIDLVTALNQTKREFAKGDYGDAFADPRIWAAFVQYGVNIALH